MAKSKSKKALNDWNTIKGKRDIYKAVVTYLQKQPIEEVMKCVDDEEHARYIVRKYGKTDIAPGAKVVFLPLKDNLRGESPARLTGLRYNAGSSLIITLPDRGLSHESLEILKYGCSYSVWGTAVSPKRQPKRRAKG